MLPIISSLKSFGSLLNLHPSTLSIRDKAIHLGIRFRLMKVRAIYAEPRWKKVYDYSVNSEILAVLVIKHQI
jgi:hypothetical protein